MYIICLYLYICINIKIYLLVLSQIAGKTRHWMFEVPRSTAFDSFRHFYSDCSVCVSQMLRKTQWIIGIIIFTHIYIYIYYTI